MSADVEAWLKSGEYLPSFMRDFHDQKDLFKALDDVAQRSRDHGNTYLDGVSFVAAQVYTVDVFLWCLARRGYTLQRSRAKLDFADLDEFVAQSKRAREAAFKEALSSR